MEYPSNEPFDGVVEAMADAISRLRALPEWAKWITFEAQGMGSREDSYVYAAIQMRGSEIRLVKRRLLDLDLLAKRARVPRDYLSQLSGTTYTLGRATPKQTARLLDAIFRLHFGIHPHPDEDDYAVGAEW
jgi:hypothetical protein